MKFYFLYYMHAHMEKVEFPAMAGGTHLAHLMVNGESKPLTHITTHIALTRSLTLIRVLRPLDFFEKGPWIDYANLAPIQLSTS